mmetsp:Transcript_23954/g.45046  ORF Transcript_23954/g.45046 Transcript_23954/m.45046 type:complete len:272 (-) Transcript_23954:705-1520(-)
MVLYEVRKIGVKELRAEQTQPAGLVHPALRQPPVRFIEGFTVFPPPLAHRLERNDSGQIPGLENHFAERAGFVQVALQHAAALQILGLYVLVRRGLVLLPGLLLHQQVKLEGHGVLLPLHELDVVKVIADPVQICKVRGRDALSPRDHLPISELTNGRIVHEPLAVLHHLLKQIHLLVLVLLLLLPLLLAPLGWLLGVPPVRAALLHAVFSIDAGETAGCRILPGVVGHDHPGQVGRDARRRMIDEVDVHILARTLQLEAARSSAVQGLAT